MDPESSTELERFREDLCRKVLGNLGTIVNRAWTLHGLSDTILEFYVHKAMYIADAEQQIWVFMEYRSKRDKVARRDYQFMWPLVNKELALMTEHVKRILRGQEGRADEGERTGFGSTEIVIEYARAELLREDADSHIRGFDYDAYHWASSSPRHICENKMSAAEAILKFGIDLPNLRSPRGNTVLHLAASVDNRAIVEDILSCSPHLKDIKNKNGDLPLHLAAAAGHIEVVKSLLFDVHTTALNVPNIRGDTAMHVALENHHLEVARHLLLAEDGANKGNLQNIHKKTPLCMAAEAGYVDLVGEMLSKKKLAVDNLVLRAAIKGRNTAVLRLLLRKVDSGPLKPKDDQEGMSPLTLASYIGNVDAVHYLLEKCPALAYLKDPNGLIPILEASKIGHVKIVEQFLDHCPDTRELLDNDDRNILHVAAAHGRAKMVKYMLKSSELQVLINERDKTGNTPLHIAVKNWQPRIVGILTRDKRVNLSILNNAGMTALDVAHESKVDKEVMFRKQLTFMALKLANAPRSEETSAIKSRLVMEDSYLTTDNGMTLPAQRTKDKSEDSLFSRRENVKTLVLVSTLVATITFAAIFAVPGGYSNSGGPHDGMATLGSGWPFQIFLICNTIATYSSITVVLALLWAQTGDLHMILCCHEICVSDVELIPSDDVHRIPCRGCSGCKTSFVAYLPSSGHRLNLHHHHIIVHYSTTGPNFPQELCHSLHLTRELHSVDDRN